MNDQQRQAIKKTAQRCFGSDAQVSLFGSRTDDRKRGGDIDLLIRTSLAEPDAIARAEIAFQVEVQQALGEQRIDVLVDSPHRRVHPPIFSIAKQTSIPL
ncbi:MAG: nucleotidyltransferase domain-containing protein [Lamprobacter sp.]|uniref:nucleotidyltransferase domain-containing protein n=1 Tax=Lamprobacter sp. TaxID=3100796 RepID=UPI002B2567C4|nr:nucleotidyltransferase domain-containing protein [Lamprobacter sp.]MEA3638996.1 nucleotidyltransferase domain-containing protein [Lamprobacter sp.]